MTTNNRKHWGLQTFRKVETTDIGKYGYCAHCYADMTIFHDDRIVRHYHSHKRAASLGLWGKR